VIQTLEFNLKTFHICVEELGTPQIGYISISNTSCQKLANLKACTHETKHECLLWGPTISYCILPLWQFI